MIKKLLNVWNIISVLIILCAIIVLISVVLTPKGQVPMILNHSLFHVRTGSMEPALMTDSLIVVKKIDAENLKVGDIITFYSSDIYIKGEINTHRIVEIKKEQGKILFVTKGDASSIVDRYPASEDSIIGKVVFSSLILGKIIRFISNPIIFILLIAIPMFDLIIFNIYDSIRIAKKIAREEEEAAVREAIEAIRKEKNMDS